MPYPRNIEVAREVEQVVRDNGAIPATIAIIGGIPRIGLSESDLLQLSNTKGNVMKASVKDMGYACSQGLDAATTVASTMRLAYLSGIAVFATGGIGGVHRGVETTWDISADLLELSRTPVTVVCAGIKSILDIPKSLEVLESNSVPVATWDSVRFPAFFTNDSGVASPLVLSSGDEVASLMLTNRAFQLPCGMVLAVPNPNPANAGKIQYAVDFAVLSAKNEGIQGAAITPYILDKVQKLTSGESLDSNVALVKNNARVATQVAVRYADLVARDGQAAQHHFAAFPPRGIYCSSSSLGAAIMGERTAPVSATPAPSIASPFTAASTAISTAAVTAVSHPSEVAPLSATADVTSNTSNAGTDVLCTNSTRSVGSGTCIASQDSNSETLQKPTTTPSSSSSSSSSSRSAVIHSRNRHSSEHSARATVAAAAAAARSNAGGVDVDIRGGRGTAGGAGVRGVSCDVLVVGGAVVDIISHVTSYTKPHTSNPGMTDCLGL